MIFNGTLKVDNELYEMKLSTTTVMAHSVLTPYQEIIHERFQNFMREIEREIKHNELANRNSQST